MATVTLPVTLTAGTPENVNNLNSNLNALVTGVNNIATAQIGNAQITGNLIGTTLAQQLGITNAANIGRGYLAIATTEARSNVAYGLLTTPDRIQNVVVPTNSKVKLTYRATWQQSVAGAAQAGIFIGANQLKVSNPAISTSPVATAASFSTGTGVDTVLVTGGTIGLSSPSPTAGSYTGDVTTGQILGTATTGVQGPVEFTVAAGTYDISVQFAATSGSVTVKNRLLMVEVVGF